jgi:hypothetical protein
VCTTKLGHLSKLPQNSSANKVAFAPRLAYA